MNTSSKKYQVLILADGRPGTFSQSIGIAEELGDEYEIVNLSYSFLACLPNFILSESLLRLSFQSRRKIKHLSHKPKIILSSGRRSAPIALALKKLFNKDAKEVKIDEASRLRLIQIMNPNLDFDKFDMVILPSHDNEKYLVGDNLVVTLGSLTRVSKDLILKERKRVFKDSDDKKVIALLLGGSSKKTNFAKISGVKIAKSASKIAENMNAKLMVLNSRRTGHNLSSIVKSNLRGDHSFFDWDDVKNDNPYLAILGYADFFIVTGDSVSMISECCSTGKPVYIFDENKISSKKHRKFHHDLVKKGYAKKLEEKLIKFDDVVTDKLEETKRVASIIKDRFY